MEAPVIGMSRSYLYTGLQLVLFPIFQKESNYHPLTTLN